MTAFLSKFQQRVKLLKFALPLVASMLRCLIPAVAALLGGWLGALAQSRPPRRARTNDPDYNSWSQWGDRNNDDDDEGGWFEPQPEPHVAGHRGGLSPRPTTWDKDSGTLTGRGLPGPPGLLPLRHGMNNHVAETCGTTTPVHGAGTTLSTTGMNCMQRFVEFGV